MDKSQSATTQSSPVLMKILIIGDMGAGKSSIINKFVSEKFDPNYKATVACEFSLKVIKMNGTEIRLHLWDIAG